MAKKEDGSKVLGRGMAREAAETIKKDKKRKENRLSVIMDGIKKNRK